MERDLEKFTKHTKKLKSVVDTAHQQAKSWWRLETAESTPASARELDRLPLGTIDVGFGRYDKVPGKVPGQYVYGGK